MIPVRSIRVEGPGMGLSSMFSVKRAETMSIASDPTRGADGGRRLKVGARNSDKLPATAEEDGW